MTTSPIYNASPCQPDNFKHIPLKRTSVLLTPFPSSSSVKFSGNSIYVLTDFQHVNRRAMWLLKSFPQYNLIRKLAYNALRGIIYIEASRWITCKMLYEK